MKLLSSYQHWVRKIWGVRYEFNHLCIYGSLQGSQSSQKKSQGLRIHRILDLQAMGPLNNLNVASYSSPCTHLIITQCDYLNIYIINSMYNLKSIKDENWHNCIFNNRWWPEQGAKEQLIIHTSDVIQHLTSNCLEGLEFQLWIGIIIHNCTQQTIYHGQCFQGSTMQVSIDQHGIFCHV